MLNLGSGGQNYASVNQGGDQRVTDQLEEEDALLMNPNFILNGIIEVD